MLINDAQVYNKRSEFLGVVTRLMSDTTSHSYECDVVVEHTCLFVMSHEYDIVVRRDKGLYLMRVFDYANKAEHTHYLCEITDIAKAIRNIHVFHEAYIYAYMYAYMLGDEYVISPILHGCDNISICIVELEKFDTIAGIEFRRHSDNNFTYRYHFGYGEHPANSPARIIKEFLEGWA